MPMPLIATSIIAVAVSRVLCPILLYHALAEAFVAGERTHPDSSRRSGRCGGDESYYVA